MAPDPGASGSPAAPSGRGQFEVERQDGIAATDAKGRHSAESHFCAHCSLVVPPRQVDPEASLQFCCEGCRTVYSVIHSEGLDEFYRLRDQSGQRGQQGRPTGREYSEFDDPALKEVCCRPAAEGLERAELYVEGVHCSACVWLVERAALGLEGVVEARLDLGRHTATVVYEPGSVQLSQVARALDRVGYRPHAHRAGGVTESRRREDRLLIIRMAVAGAATGNVMLMSAALYSGAFAGMEPEFVTLFRWGSLLVSLPAVLWSAKPFFVGAFHALRQRTSHMDLPVSVGILAGFVSGVVATVRAQGDIYFDSITALIFLLLVGRWLQNRQQRIAQDAAEVASALTPATARVVVGGGIAVAASEDISRHVQTVPAEAVRPGAWVQVLAGERLPVDGDVLHGSSMLDMSLLTGESAPRAVGPGAAVYAGTTNIEAPVLIVAERTGVHTRVAQLMDKVEQAVRSRAPVVLLADRLAARFVAAVLVLAAVAFALHASRNVATAAEHAVAVLVVSCPCALGLATPLAVSVALGRAARSGILIKGGRAIELLASSHLVVFDKTGTLTQGKLELVDFHGDASVKSLVRSLEEHSAHPAASGLVRAFGDAPRSPVSDIQQQTGGGIQGSVAGRIVRVGSFEYVTEQAAREEWACQLVETASFDGKTSVVVAVDRRIVAVATLGDPLRKDAGVSLSKLRESGYKLAILSGDHPRVVQRVAAELGGPWIEVLGAVTPEGKLRFIREAASAQSVVMVGDGVNDAAALAAATVGVAVHGGAEASLGAADVFVATSGVEPVSELFEGARRTMAVIRKNLAFSLVYNVFAIAFAMAGWVGPLTAAVLMPVSSLKVITSCYRARTFQYQPDRERTRL